uniref:Uncharacterized protein n=1 Tax=Arundo donax TaxID=35708 RepID=A0A0A9FFP8_ARUDO
MAPLHRRCACAPLLGRSSTPRRRALSTTVILPAGMRASWHHYAGRAQPLAPRHGDAVRAATPSPAIHLAGDVKPSPEVTFPAGNSLASYE